MLARTLASAVAGLSLLVVPACPQDATTPAREVHYPGLVGANPTLGLRTRYDHGFVVGVGRRGPDSIVVYDSKGEFVFEVIVKGPNGVRSIVLDLAMRGDGVLFVALDYHLPSRQLGGAIAQLDTAGNVTRLINTGPYIPRSLCLGPGDSIWVLGFEHKQIDVATKSLDSRPIIRRYNQGSDEVRSSASFDFEYSVGMIRASGERIGVLTTARTTDRTLWTELDSEGAVIGRWWLGSIPVRVNPLFAVPIASYLGYGHTRVSYSSSGKLYSFCFMCGVGDGPNLTRFVPGTEQWEILKRIPRSYGYLVGSDGDNLVYAADEGDGITLRWVRPQ